MSTINLHITIGSDDDIDQLKDDAKNHGYTTWPVPKAAKMGDWVFLYHP